MLRRLIVLLAVLALAAVGVMPSQAAAKKKPDLKGGYTVMLYPDPSQNALNQTGEGCRGALAQGKDIRSFTVPAAGKLTMNLVSPDPTNKGVTDWDLWVMDADRVSITASHGPASSEQTVTTFKKKTVVSVEVCNVNGTTTGTVSWVFKFA